MLALQRKDAAVAATHLGKVGGALEEPALAAFLEGRVRFVEGRFAEARVRFLEAVRQDGRRVDAQLWAGAAAAAGGQPEEAFHLMQGALAMDPVRVAPPPSQARFFLAPGETLQGAEGHLLALARGTSTVPARLYEGLVRYHQGDLAGADRLLRSVVDEDMQNPVAHALRALVALRQRNAAQALRSAAAADRNGRQLPLAQFAWGEVLASRGEEAEALRAFRLAHTLAPALSSPAVRLAQMEAATGARVAARERLMKLVGRDPSDVAAKRALYAIDTRG
jgi:tetratricopeptide (TPR) repeat protein